VSLVPGGSQSVSALKVSNASSVRDVTLTASTGQTCSQCPQFIDEFPVTAALPSTIEIVCEGQTLTHSPQPMHLALSIIVLTVLSMSIDLYFISFYLVFIITDLALPCSDYGSYAITFLEQYPDFGSSHCLIEARYMVSAPFEL
jgi:hypothetical protein